MSDHWLVFIPRDPRFIPAAEEHAATIDLVGALFPSAQSVDAARSAHILFRDCGGNAESISCPGCSVAMDGGAWGEWMDQDFDGEGFRLEERPMACCGAPVTLNDLRYQFDQGFSRYEISVMNPDVGTLGEDAVAGIGEKLGYPIRVIYRHV
jgi:hypothetical protein